MALTLRKARKIVGLYRFREKCRTQVSNGREVKAYFIPGTPEFDVDIELSVLADDLFDVSQRRSFHVVRQH